MGNLPIEGFGLSGYRSFGEELQLLGKFQKINLFIGKNNSGKSNALRFIRKHYSQAFGQGSNRKKLDFEDLDFYGGNKLQPVRLLYAITNFENYIDDLGEIKSGKWSRRAAVELKKLPQAEIFNRGTGAFWLEYESSSEGLVFTTDYIERIYQSGINSTTWSTIWSAIRGSGGGRPLEHWIPYSLKAINPIYKKKIQIASISAIRKVGEPNSDKPPDYSGEGLISRLAVLQNPDYDQQDLKDRFSQINDFLQNVLENKSAILEIPASRETILVHMDGKTLPLSNLGTGVHETIILAAAATLLSNHAVCIEEPELHLHPQMQRKLLGKYPLTSRIEGRIIVHGGIY